MAAVLLPAARTFYVLRFAPVQIFSGEAALASGAIIVLETAWRLIERRAGRAEYAPTGCPAR